MKFVESCLLTSPSSSCPVRRLFQNFPQQPGESTRGRGGVRECFSSHRGRKPEAKERRCRLRKEKVEGEVVEYTMNHSQLIARSLELEIKRNHLYRYMTA